MNARPPPPNQDLRPDPEAFSLMLGGPVFQLLRRAHLADNAQMLLSRRILVIVLLTWVPLLVLSVIEGNLFSGTVTVPFLWDLEIHVRYLVAIPLLIGAELAVDQRLRPTVRQFLERQIIPAGAIPQLNAAIAAAFRLRDSVFAEVLTIAAVYSVGVLIIWRHYMAFDMSSWYAIPAGGRTELSLAGIWYGYVSVPIFQFLLCRWYFRIAVWGRFLWQVSRIELSLMPANPDRTAGLGFLSNTVNAFTLLGLAHGALLAGFLANRILYLGASLTDFKMEIAIAVLFLLCIVAGPLTVFAPQLSRAKRTGNLEYGALAERYVREFDTKWLRGGAPAGEPLVGSGDIQSLADLGNSMAVVRTMRIAPVTKEAIARLVITILVPIAPLALTMMAWDQLLRTLIGVVF